MKPLEVTIEHVDGALMAYWRRCGPVIVGRFSGDQIRLLRWHVGRFRTMLVDAEAWEATQTSGDEDFSLKRRTREAHERAMAIVRRRVRTPPSHAAGVEPESFHLRTMVTDAGQVIDALENISKRALLIYPAEYTAWIWTLYECAMDMAFHHGLPWHSDKSPDVTGQPFFSELLQQSVSWLLGITHSLADVVDLSPEPVNGW